jgi:RNA polymerase sigma-70 factor (ECF subfamily)
MHTTTRLLHERSSEPRATFATLHEHLAPQMFLWAALHVGAPLRRWLTIEDFVQEVWARAYAGFGTFDTARGTFRGWLLGIAHNVLREQLRRLRVRQTNPDESEAEHDPRDRGTSVVTQVLRDERRDALLLAIDRLTDDERRVVIWRSFDGLSHEQIGRRLGIGAAGAESRYRRALQQLEGLLPPDLLPERT